MTDFNGTWYVALRTPAIIVRFNHDLGLTLIYDTVRSIWSHMIFNFSKRFVAFDQKVDRQFIELM